MFPKTRQFSRKKNLAQVKIEGQNETPKKGSYIKYLMK